MARHSIDAALLAGPGPGRGPAPAGSASTARTRGRRPCSWTPSRRRTAARPCGPSEFGFSTVVGHAPDLEAVELLYTSLLVQADRALHAGRTSRSRDFRESFLIAYASRIRARLDLRDRGGGRGGGGRAPELLPALRSRALAVEDATRRLFPSTTTSRLSARDAAGWQEGESAADAARLGG